MLNPSAADTSKKNLPSNYVRTFGFSGTSSTTPYIVPDGHFVLIYCLTSVSSICEINGVKANGSSSNPFTLKAGDSFKPSINTTINYYTIEEYTL